MVGLQHGIHRARNAVLLHHFWQRWLAQGWKSHQVCGVLVELQLARRGQHLRSPAHRKLDNATGPGWACDAQHFRVRNKPFLKDRQKATSFSTYSSISPSSHHATYTARSRWKLFSVESTGDSLSKRSAGLESSRVVFPAAPGPGSTAGGHCQNPPGVGLQLYREIS